ncbi:uncharacterized protein LOC122378043 [Amphibalanus amphitrite]|uniref:uncharacterized protein LOC122378043 n=1 Tax=Amphibalanus amphitrite TaxID=1232801 RepID=UPI001C924283|nr:uncharacterized protein LOC122378043 [Amphibalanus amphitrite]
MSKIDSVQPQTPEDTDEEPSGRAERCLPSRDGLAQDVPGIRGLAARDGVTVPGVKRPRAVTPPSATEDRPVDEADGITKRRRDETLAERIEAQEKRDAAAMEAWEGIRAAAQSRQRKEQQRPAEESPVRSALETMLGVLAAEGHARKDRYKH